MRPAREPTNRRREDVAGHSAPGSGRKQNSMDATDNFASVAAVERIAALVEPVTRNLQITQSYHALAVGLAQRTGPNANWCSFATWASKQAGQTIRHEDLEHALQDALMAAPATALAAARVAAAAQQLGARLDSADIQRRVWVALDLTGAMRRAADAVGRGNQKVFAEIGREFARFGATCQNDASFQAANLANFCAALRPGDPPDGQDYLRRAFTRYYQALFETDPKSSAELMLLANLEIGFHEQTRLQPEIAEGLDASLGDPEQSVPQLVAALFPERGWLAQEALTVLSRLEGQSALDLALDGLIAAAQEQIRVLLTEHMMELGLPNGGRLRLGDDLQGKFPPLLQQLANPDLRAFLAQHDPTPDSLRDTGVVDWANLPDRMHFIADLFRLYSQAPDWLVPPFTPDQAAAIQAGRLPDGPL